MGLPEVIDCFIKNKNTGNTYHGSFYGCGNELYFAVPVRMIEVAGLGRKVNAVQPDESGYHIYNAFQCIGKDGNRVGKVPGNNFNDKQDNRKINGDGALYLKIFRVDVGNGVRIDANKDIQLKKWKCTTGAGERMR